ncbi:MAG: FtsX-like permease family protein, partial [Chloroflexota bacterium]
IETFRFLAVSLSPDADRSAANAELLRAAEGLGLEAVSVANLKASVNRAVDSLLGLLLGLVAVGVVVGVLGILNTMVMNIGLRLREIGLLRAAGMSTGQVQGLFVVEATIIGFQGSFLGVVLGALVTWVLVSVARTPDFEPQFTFSFPFAVAVVGLGIAGAVLAAVYPARSAASTNIIEAVRHR